MGIDSHILFIIAGILMVVLPFFLAPPEIILDIKENTFVFRNGMTYSTIYFSDIKTLTVDNDIMLIKSIQNKENISIYQDHFKHIPLPKMKKYIESILAGNTNFDPWQFNSVKLRGRLLLG